MLTPNRSPKVRKVEIPGSPVVFYVGPAGVLVLSEVVSGRLPLRGEGAVAQAEARKVYEDSGGAIPAIPALLVKGGEGEGRVDGLLAFRSEAEVVDYLRGGDGLDPREVDRVAGWLGNRLRRPPSIRPKKRQERVSEPPSGVQSEEAKGPHRHSSGLPKEEQATPPDLPSSAKKRPLRKSRKGRALLSRLPRGVKAVGKVLGRVSWRATFLPELLLALWAIPHYRFGGILFSTVLVLRFWALFGRDPNGWKRFFLFGVGAMEVIPFFMDLGRPIWGFSVYLLLLAALSFARGFWLFLPERRLQPIPDLRSSHHPKSRGYNGPWR